MGVKVAGATHRLQLPHPIVPQYPPSSQRVPSAILSPSSTLRPRLYSGPLLCRYVPNLDRSSPFGSPGIRRLASFELPSPRRAWTVARASSVAPDSFSDEEFSRKIRELALQFQLSTDDVSSAQDKTENTVDLRMDYVEPNWPEEVIPVNLDREANSVDLPLSLRVIKRKMEWNEGFREAGESAYCSVKKAFSSMVFIIRELHSFTLQMREILFYEDLQGILSRVHKEMHASFVWLFQQIFCHTPTLMVYVMILLANFTVYSMGSSSAIAVVASQVGSHSASTESVSQLDIKDGGNKQSRFDSSSLRSFKISSGGSKTTSVGGHNGGGGKVRPVATGTGGDGEFPQADRYRGVLPDGASSHLSSFGKSSKEEESVSGREVVEEEVGLWNSVVEEASKMQGPLSHEWIDHETRLSLVSPVIAKIEADNYEDYIATELSYRNSLSQDPDNPLLLANYAQFLYLVSNDYDRAEEHFKRAIAVDPVDAEAYNMYASFLWRARNDVCAAEETFLGAISADPSNSFYAANYAHFLWNSGGDDTCFPLALDQHPPSHNSS